MVPNNFDATNALERGIKIMEDERQRVARDLHDGPAQVFSDLAMRIEGVITILQKKPERAMEELIRVRRDLEDSANEVRQSIYDLRSVAVDELGIVHTLQQHCQNFARNWRIEIEFNADEDVSEDFAPAKRLVIYRIAQEILNNIRKHAAATKIEVTLRRETKNLILEIRDNGKGFDTHAVYEGHYGLMSIRERAQYLEGHVDIKSKLGAGSEFIATLPVYE